MTGGRILVVEDENIVALDLRMRLESMGYSVVGVADSGEDALALMGSAAPDLVLMDIKLRGDMDGVDAARAAVGRFDTPVVFATAFTDEKTLERAKLASPYGYVVKPFHERELRIAIELALYKSGYERSLRREKELAEEANRLKGEFLANMSHELKTPLNSVIGFTEIALGLASGEEEKDCLRSALRGARTLVGLIDSILDYSRLEAGGVEPRSELFSLEGLLGPLVALLRAEARRKGLEAAFLREEGVPDGLRGDGPRLRGILTNLVDNALKFTAKGFVRLTVSALPAAAAGGAGEAERVEAPGEPGVLLRFAVEDSGPGMDAAGVAAALKRFTQLDGGRNRPAGGTGLGLAIVREGVELLGGELRVASEPGRGSRFEVDLPFRVAAGQGSARRDGAPRSGEGGGPPSTHPGARLPGGDSVGDRAATRALFAARLASALATVDFEAAEREARDYRARFEELGDEAGERQAFTALLRARKGDEAGLRALAERIADDAAGGAG